MEDAPNRRSSSVIDGKRTANSATDSLAWSLPWLWHRQADVPQPTIHPVADRSHAGLHRRPGSNRIGSVVNPEHLLAQGGLFVLALIVFAESGILAGFFLPGDSLLFIGGFLTSAAGGHRLPALPVVVLVAFVAAVAGDQTGYLIGRKLGPTLFRRPDSRLFRREHLTLAEGFFERHGNRTIVLARFVPVVRTFAPVLAGASRMTYRSFVTYNIVGGLLWARGLTTAGHYLGQVGFIRTHIELTVLAVVALSLIPVILELARHTRDRRASTEAEQRGPDPV